MNSFWRKLHLFSTIFAGIFILLASVTGCILAVEPWVLRQNAVSGQTDANVTLLDFQKKLDANFVEIFSFEKDAYGNIKVEGIGFEKEGTLYVETQTGNVINAPKQVSAIFDFNRNLHRSLFLKTPGRILVGLASLAMVFLVLSGIGLHIKRAGGLKSVFKKITILHYKRDGHAQWSRWFFLPILIIAISGTYLSVVRFTPDSVPINLALANQDLESKNILLRDVKKVSYPILADEPMVISLANKILYADKSQGKIIKIEQLPVAERLKSLSFWLHTGEGTVGWTGVLLITSFIMTFLSITGFQMILEKLIRKKSKSVHHEESDILILVGSETGHTWRFADALAHAYQKTDVNVNVIGMDKIPVLQGKKTILMLTSTYGDGVAPENAQNVIKELQNKFSTAELIQFGVLGFGATQYPAFCAFAQKLRDETIKLKNTQEVTPYMTVDNQSVSHFIDWIKVLNNSQKINLTIDTNQLKTVRKKGLKKFKIIEKVVQRDTFILRITNPQNIQSGDLLGIYPPNENIERYYSVARLNDKELVLVIKRTGLCSNYLGDLESNESFEGYIKPNPHFHYPNHQKPVLMIANGTGIAPFLGMQTPESMLFWGGKYETDFDLFSDYFVNTSTEKVFSRENKQQNYVQNLLFNKEEEVVNLLHQQGSIMICGSLSMLQGTLTNLDLVINKHNLQSVETLKKQGRLLVDCY
ncbi:MAG: PepSY domain-containing protein [Emticicia sp.]|nr:PepSY domain-containing protein [Emticicia sp.]